MKKKGLSIHCHHGILYEYCHDYDERIKYIEENKPEHERKTRLKLFKILPDEALLDLPKEYLVDSAKFWQDKAKFCQDTAKSCQDSAKYYQDKAKFHQDEAKFYQDAAKSCQDSAKYYQDKAKFHQDEAKFWQYIAKFHQDAAKFCQDAAKYYQDALRKKGNHGTLSNEEFHAKWCGCKEWQNGQLNFGEK